MSLYCMTEYARSIVEWIEEGFFLHLRRSVRLYLSLCQSVSQSFCLSLFSCGWCKSCKCTHDAVVKPLWNDDKAIFSSVFRNFRTAPQYLKRRREKRKKNFSHILQRAYLTIIAGFFLISRVLPANRNKDIFFP